MYLQKQQQKKKTKKKNRDTSGRNLWQLAMSVTTC